MKGITVRWAPTCHPLSVVSFFISSDAEMKGIPSCLYSIRQLLGGCPPVILSLLLLPSSVQMRAAQAITRAELTRPCRIRRGCIHAPPPIHHRHSWAEVDLGPRQTSCRHAGAPRWGLAGTMPLVCAWSPTRLLVRGRP